VAGACPLCMSAETAPFCKDRRREFRRCAVCRLIFVPAVYHLPAEAERRRYLTHRNGPHDDRYRAFLGRLHDPLIARLPPGARGIDFGCGPGPTLSVMFAESGFAMVNYDPCFFSEFGLLQDRYDFLTCSEAIEHFCTPAVEWQRFLGLVHRGGWIGIMTARVDEVEDFNSWYYKEDPTHVCFYSQATFDWLAARDALAVEYSGDSVVLLRRR